MNWWEPGWKPDWPVVMPTPERAAQVDAAIAKRAEGTAS